MLSTKHLPSVAGSEMIVHLSVEEGWPRKHWIQILPELHCDRKMEIHIPCQTIEHSARMCRYHDAQWNVILYRMQWRSRQDSKTRTLWKCHGNNICKILRRDPWGRWLCVIMETEQRSCVLWVSVIHNGLTWAGIFEWLGNIFVEHELRWNRRCGSWSRACSCSMEAGQDIWGAKTRTICTVAVDIMGVEKRWCKSTALKIIEASEEFC